MHDDGSLGCAIWSLIVLHDETGADPRVIEAAIKEVNRRAARRTLTGPVDGVMDIMNEAMLASQRKAWMTKK